MVICYIQGAVMGKFVIKTDMQCFSVYMIVCVLVQALVWYDYQLTA